MHNGSCQIVNRECSGIVVERRESELRGPGFNPHKRHGVVSLSKTHYRLQYWLNPGSVGSVLT